MWPIADAHTDYLMNLRLKHTALNADMLSQRHVSLPSLRLGNVRLQVFAAFAGDSALGNPLMQAIEQIRWYLCMLDAWGEDIVPVGIKRDLDRLEEQPCVRSVLSIEGGEAVAGSYFVLDILHLLGVRIVTLLWNKENEIGYPAVELESAQKKLKPFGRECIEYLNRKGVAVDVSHLNKAGFWDVMERSSKPVMASHSNVQALCPHPRNLDDEQIKALIKSNGFIGLNFYPMFLTQNDVCTVDDIVRHAIHILDLGGEDILGFGSDFDGILCTPEGIGGAQDFPIIAQALERTGIKASLIEKICCRNLQRYLSQVLPE